jgi:hypothetical protein
LDTPIWDPDLGPRFGTPIWDPDLGPRFGTPIWDPDLGPRYKTLIWDPDLGPRFGTPILFLIYFGKPPNTMFPISDRVRIVFGHPSQQWATLILIN